MERGLFLLPAAALYCRILILHWSWTETTLIMVYDFVILAILICGAWQGANRGLVMQLAWIVAIVLCFRFADRLAPQIESFIGVEPPLRHWIAMFILYLGFSLGTFFAARSLSTAIEKAKFKDFDRHLGGLFGLLKGAVLSLVLTFFSVTLSESLQKTVVRSKTGFVACKILDTIRPLTPEDAHPLIHESLDKYQDALNEVHKEHLGEEVSLDDILSETTDGARDRRNWLSDIGGTGRFPEVGLADDDSGPSYNGLLDLASEPIRGQMRRASLRDRWNHMAAADRERWLDDLRYKSSDEKSSVLQRLIQLLEGQGEAAFAAVDSGLIRRIAGEYRDHEDPGLMAVRINQYLSDLPEQVQTAVLEDWYVDLIGEGADPDPSTDGDTRIDDRILNQLDQAGISTNQLSDDLRTRLQRSR